MGRTSGGKKMAGKVVGYHPEIPPGEYLVRYCGYETGRSWNSKKVKVNFAVVDGEYEGIPLARYYNARNLSDPVGPNGDFEIGDRCHLLKEYRALLPNVRSTSQIDLDHYKGKLIRAKVRTVNESGNGETLGDNNQYSVIDRLIEIIPETYE